MISKNTVLQIHHSLIEVYGGAKGIRNLSLLESAINRPFATFDGVDLYPTALHKAAAIFQSILINHPFLDGNKRTALALLLYVLKSGNNILTINENEIYEFVISCSKGEKEFDEILIWLQIHSQ